jgi:hypothetical protein
MNWLVSIACGAFLAYAIVIAMSWFDDVRDWWKL